MSASSVLSFEFKPASDAARKNDGWGQGMLRLNGEPFWFSSSDGEPQAFEWTWVDLLEHLAEVWGYLVAEQSYPYPWLTDVAHPGEVWSFAERRWARLGNEVADREEPRLLEFDRCHNLAASWQGLGLPALTWLRVGETVWLCPEAREPVRAAFKECCDVLLRIGDAMASAFSGSTNARVASAVSAWPKRGEVVSAQFLEIATGLTSVELQAIQNGQDARDYWELAANSNWESGEIIDGELLAAARMTSGVVSAANIGRILREIKALKRGKRDELDSLTGKVATYLAKNRSTFAFEAGYVAAEFIKSNLSDARRKFVDINEILRRLKVDVLDVSFGSDAIDAVAVWGARGPCVLLNSDRALVDHNKRTRMTLAHEFGHLVMDRLSGLPFCEVLGGRVDDFVERRANAFAAELLLPRSSVVHEWGLWRGDFRSFLLLLNRDYGVSNTVACAQIHNSTAFEMLDRAAREYVSKRLIDFEGRVAPSSVKLSSGVV